MIVLDLTHDKLIDMIDKSKDLQMGGFSGSLFLYKNYLIKMDRNLYHPLKHQDMRYGDKVKNILLYGKTRKLAHEEQLNFLASKQENVKLTTFDLGIVKVEGTLCGVILPNFLDYQNLGDFEITNLEDMFHLFALLQRLLEVLKELEDNDISQTDLLNDISLKMNILYKDNDIKLCDLEGVMVKYGKNTYAYLMYLEYSKVLMYFLTKIKKLYKEAAFLIEELKQKPLVNYEMALEFLGTMGNFLNSFNFYQAGYNDGTKNESPLKN